MGTFCYDQYDHPLLWCEEKKRLVERKNADESIKQWNRKKVEELARVERDKKEYHEMVLNHCPWGRPGGGAPNLDIRIRDITAEGLHPTPKVYPTHQIQSIRTSALPPCRVTCGAARGDGGAGSHIRSAADHLYITLKDHPSMTFRNKGHVDIELRYKQLPKGKPKMQLEKIVVSEAPDCKAIKKRHCHKTAHHHHQDHWGKAVTGGGGPPWRNPKKVSGNSFMRSLGWTNKEMMKDLDQENPQTAASEKPMKKNAKLKAIEPIVRTCCPLCSCKCTAVSLDSAEPTPPPQPPPPAQSSSPKKQNSQEHSKATIHHHHTCNENRKSPTKPRIERLCNKKRESGNHRSKVCDNIELVPLLAKRRNMHRPISLSSTDVTNKTSDANRWTKKSDQIELLCELKRQMAQRKKRTKFTNDREKYECLEHYKTFDTFWGRPGHGAPKNHKNKLKLDDLLYGVSSQTDDC